MPLIGNLIKSRVKSALTNAFGGQLRYFICGGAAMNPVVEKCLMDIHFPLSIGYGMTETGPLIGGNPPKYFKRRSCGVPVANMEVKIDMTNVDNEEALKNGIGEILVRGANVMLGYYKNEEATKAVFTEDGWMRTGDLGILDRQGNIYIHGRSKNMILGPSGQNIYPEEIEDKINSMPGVVESIVVDRDHKLVALIFPENPGDNNVVALMEEHRVALNKQLPQYSQIASVEVVPQEFEKTPKKSIKRFLYS